jgi:hypothetical protein
MLVTATVSIICCCSRHIDKFNIIGCWKSVGNNNLVWTGIGVVSGSGINVNFGSSNNKIFANTMSGNTFSSNKIIGATSEGLEIEQDPTSKNNIFSNYQLIHSSTQATSG